MRSKRKEAPRIPAAERQRPGGLHFCFSLELHRTKHKHPKTHTQTHRHKKIPANLTPHMLLPSLSPPSPQPHPPLPPSPLPDITLARILPPNRQPHFCSNDLNSQTQKDTTRQAQPLQRLPLSYKRISGRQSSMSTDVSILCRIRLRLLS